MSFTLRPAADPPGPVDGRLGRTWAEPRCPVDDDFAGAPAAGSLDRRRRVRSPAPRAVPSVETASPPATETPWPPSPKEVETALRAYEVMVILDPDLEERTVAPSLDTYLNVVRNDGGTVENVDIWGRRRLAYEIDKRRRGHLRRRHAERRAGHREGARPSAHAERVGAAHQGHPTRRPLTASAPRRSCRASATVGDGPISADSPGHRSPSSSSPALVHTTGGLTWQAKPRSPWSAT